MPPLAVLGLVMPPLAVLGLVMPPLAVLGLRPARGGLPPMRLLASLVARMGETALA